MTMEDIGITKEKNRNNKRESKNNKVEIKINLKNILYLKIIYKNSPSKWVFKGDNDNE